MLRTLSVLLSIQTSSTANLFIYFFRKLPWVGRLVPEKLYANREWKRSLAVVAAIALAVWGFASRFAYVGLMLYLPVVLFGEQWSTDEQLLQFVYTFGLLSFLVAGASSAIILEPKRSKYIAIKWFRMSPRRYMHTTLAYRYAMFAVYLLPAMLVFGKSLGASAFQLVLLTLSATLWRIGWEAFHLKLFEKKEIVLIKKVGFVWMVIIAGYFAAYFPLFGGTAPPPAGFMLFWPVHLAVIAIGAFAAVWLARYPDYRAVVDAATKRDDPLLDFGRMMREANQTAIQSEASDYTMEGFRKELVDTKKGYALLNALFFMRHRSLVGRPVRIRLMIIGAAGAAGVAWVSFVEQTAVALQTHLGAMLSYLFPVMFFMTVGEKICRAMFHHCDLSMMRYSFYRKGAFQHFRIRLYKVAGYNMLIAAALGAAITLAYMAAGGQVLHPQVLQLWLCVISLGVFFSVYHLAIYYLLQPYATELNIKSPLYFVVTYLVSAASGICIFIRVPSDVFTITVLAVTILCGVSAVTLVRLYASRTFVVK